MQKVSLENTIAAFHAFGTVEIRKKKIPTELNPNVEVQDYFFSIPSYSTRHEDQTPRENHESHSVVLFEKIIKVLSLIPHMYACMYIHCVPKIVVEVERRSFTMQR